MVNQALYFGNHTFKVVFGVLPNPVLREKEGKERMTFTNRRVYKSDRGEKLKTEKNENKPILFY